MMEESGTVTKVEGIMAKVAVQKKSSCDGCTAGGACQSTPEGALIEAFNPVHASVGQVVRISFKPYTYLKGTMLVYGFPVVALIAGAIIGKSIGELYFQDVNSDMVAAIMGFLLLGLSLLGIKIWSDKMESKTEYKPVIEEILDQGT
jgi:sigma-E factor negative regulatory protein RseC